MEGPDETLVEQVMAQSAAQAAAQRSKAQMVWNSEQMGNTLLASNTNFYDMTDKIGVLPRCNTGSSPCAFDFVGHLEALPGNEAAVQDDLDALARDAKSMWQDLAQPLIAKYQKEIDDQGLDAVVMIRFAVTNEGLRVFLGADARS